MSRSIEITILGDASSLSRGLQSAGAETEAFDAKTQKMSGTLEETGGVVSKFASHAMEAFAAAFAVEKVVDFTKECVGGAEELQKSQEVVKMSFGDSSDAVLKFGDDAAASFGVSASTADGVSAKFGILFQNMGIGHTAAADMTVGWEQLAMAMSKIKGVDPTTALNAMTMAAQGNSKGLKSLGIDITTTAKDQEAATLGLGDHYSKLTAAQQATVMYDLATQGLGKRLEEAKAHSGDLTDETAVLEAEFSNLKDKIGLALLPILTEAAHWLGQELPVAITYLKEGFHDLEPEIQNVEQIVKDLESVVNDNMGMIKTVIADLESAFEHDMAAIGDALSLVSDLLSGNWSKAWQDAKSLVNNVVAEIESLLSADAAVFLRIAKNLGNAILSGLSSGVQALPGLITDALSGIVDLISGAELWLGQEALSLGESLVNGIVNGLSGLYDAVKGKIEGTLSSVLHSIDIPGFSPPDHAASEAIGQPLASGVIQGWLDGTVALPATLSNTLTAAINAAQKVVATSRSSFSTAFQSLTSNVDSAYQGITGAEQTPAEKVIAAIQAQQQKQQLASSLEQAKQALEAGLRNKKTTAAQMEQLQLAVNNAESAIQVAHLQVIAAEQRKQLNAENTLQQTHLDERLAALEASLAKEGASQKTAHAKIMALLASFGIDYHTAGQAMGTAFITGLQEALDAAASRSQALQTVIGSTAASLGGKSDGWYGAISKIPTAASGGYVDQQGLAIIHKGETIVPDGAVVAAAAGGGATRGTPDIHFHIGEGGTFIGGKPDQVVRDLLPALGTAMREYMRSNGGRQFGVVPT